MDNSKTDNEFNTQEIQDIISTQELRKETLKTNTNKIAIFNENNGI